MPKKVATLKKQNEQLKSQIAELSSGLKTSRRCSRNADSNLRSYSWINYWNFRPWDGEEFYSDSYDGLNSFQAKAIREPKCLSDRLSKISTEVESIGKAVDDLKKHI